MATFEPEQSMLLLGYPHWKDRYQAQEQGYQQQQKSNRNARKQLKVDGNGNRGDAAQKEKNTPHHAATHPLFDHRADRQPNRALTTQNQIGEQKYDD